MTMAAKKEICKEITRYFIGDIDDPRLDELEGERFFSDKSQCEEGRLMLVDMNMDYDTPSKVYTVKITLHED